MFFFCIFYVPSKGDHMTTLVCDVRLFGLEMWWCLRFGHSCEEYGPCSEVPTFDKGESLLTDLIPRAPGSMQLWQIHPRNLTANAPEKWWDWKIEFPFGIAEFEGFEGRTVKFQGCKDQINQLDGGNSNIFLFIFAPQLGEDDFQFGDHHIFLRWVETWNHQLVNLAKNVFRSWYIHFGSTQDAIVANEGWGLGKSM